MSKETGQMKLLDVYDYNAHILKKDPNNRGIFFDSDDWDWRKHFLYNFLLISKFSEET